MKPIARGPVVVAFTALMSSATAVALNSTQGSRDVPSQFNEFTVAQLQEEMNSHRLTSERLTRYISTAFSRSIRRVLESIP